MKYFFLISAFLCLASVTAQQGQKSVFTQQDTLKGSITPERAWWDVTYYHLDIEVSPNTKSIKGKNTVHYKVLDTHNILQIDLQPPLIITKVIQNNETLSVNSNGNAHFITLKQMAAIGDVNAVDVYYEGQPKIAVKPPWDGGITWQEDAKGNPFIASACQGIGASVWWPNKDHMYDEVDSMAISVNVPKGIMDVSNGRLRGVEKHDNATNTYHWFVNNPINNYGVNINIADYAHFSEVYDGEKGKLDMNYFVLPENLEKAKIHFKDATKMMEAFEYWFGPYPFYEDGFKLVEVPYLGMEHQSSVTYGNGYKKGYLGRDLSDTGWGLKFDFIIIHEAGHEWFANNITNKDNADMWIHEGFTAYSENLFLDYYYGKEASADYVIGTRKLILNDTPIIGIYNVNQRGSGDMYYKGANLLHTLRQLVDNDETWRRVLRGLNTEFYHQTVTTAQIESYICQETELNLSAFFDQYLRDVRIPNLVYSLDGNAITFKYENAVADFNMPVKIKVNGTEHWITPSSEWSNKVFDSTITKIEIDRNFYITSSKK